ncbi:hypothetical protein [Mesonia maritima]|uniref:P/Homo B domain-containing protein n=1 Tax=Mesonia maritima TaxID=1793873 RepID=A0ABU1K4F9_9FLAO|nr:hypothetical protein [Mesonia maritima]MDR6300145.1 hypothetical protein [Mesonia maritima]
MKSLLLFFTCLLSIVTIAQNKTSQYKDQSTQVNLQRNIQIKQDTREQEITIEIDNQTKKIELMIHSSVSLGQLSIEIYDSKGKKQGDFSVGNQLNTNVSEQVEGNITKSLIEPQEGLWKVKIIPIKAKGMVQISTFTFH